MEKLVRNAYSTTKIQEGTALCSFIKISFWVLKLAYALKIVYSSVYMHTLTHLRTDSMSTIMFVHGTFKRKPAA